MKFLNYSLKIILFLAATVLISNCEKLSRYGVCTGFSAEYNSTYCKDGWSRAECEEWNDLQVNGVDWYFHPGQTCEERGTPATQ